MYPPPPCTIPQIRQRLESPRAATDLWGEDAPEADEMDRLRGLLEFVLSKRRPGDDEVASSSAGGASSHGSSPSQWRGAPKYLVASDAGPATNLAFFTRLEALLNVDNGIEAVDAELAAWLDMVLPQSDT